jgi:hypothetical protein
MTDRKWTVSLKAPDLRTGMDYKRILASRLTVTDNALVFTGELDEVVYVVPLERIKDVTGGDLYT